ncbi:MAG: alpha/beta family hydrolase [Chloroflexota bacterium]
MALHTYLGHGASGSAASMEPFVRGLIERGLAATAVDLPRRKAEDAVPAWRAVVPDGPTVVVGGQSYGGRVSTLAAAEPDTGYRAIVLFSYPLHPPGSPELAAARVSHWPLIHCPVLLLSGESDPFARLELLKAAVPLLEHGTLVTYPKLGHGLRPVLEDVLDRVASFLESLGD